MEGGFHFFADIFLFLLLPFGLTAGSVRTRAYYDPSNSPAILQHVLLTFHC